MSARSPAPFAIPDQPLQADIVAKYFRAFGDPTRVQIMQLLRDHERSVTELVELLGAPQPKISNHLACLRWCRFVESRREHRAVYYRIADERIGAILDLAHDVLRENAEHVAACERIQDAEPPAGD